MLVKQLLKSPKCASKRFTRFLSNRNILSLKDRGMYHDLFPENSAREVADLLNSQPQTVYAGFDPTSDSLHIGNLLVLINLLHWQRGGHNVIALLGGATAKIGDPSGRTTERDEITEALIDKNLKGIKTNIETIFRNHQRYFWRDNTSYLPEVTIVNNEDWYGDMNAVKFLGGPGRYLRMGTLLSRTSVQTRLNSPVGMSFTEFSYQLFQAYDWLYLYKKFKCRFQIGGADQTGNVMSGHELISKTCKIPVYGLTVPIITSEMGDKFGKSAGNAIWLAPEKTSPFTYYQFWIRLSDVDAERLLKLFTFYAIGEIKDIMRQHKEKPELRIAQKKLAEHVTILVHGEDGLKVAEAATRALYEGNIDALGQMRVNDLMQMFQGASVVDVMLHSGMDILNFALKAKCFPSADDAFRIISAGGFSINQRRVKNPKEIINREQHILSNDVSIVRVGKKNYYIVKWV